MSDKKPDKKPLPEITIASQIAIDALWPYVQQVLDAIGDSSGMEGTRDAMVTDESCVSDFYPGAGIPTGEERPHPFLAGKKIKTYDYDTPENRDYVQKLGELLELPVGKHDYIYELAIKLRDRG